MLILKQMSGSTGTTYPESLRNILLQLDKSKSRRLILLQCVEFFRLLTFYTIFYFFGFLIVWWHLALEFCVTGHLVSLNLDGNSDFV